MIRRPPRSTRTDTLFPYTTLFRSVEQGTAKGDALAFAARQLSGAALHQWRDFQHVEHSLQIEAPLRGCKVPLPVEQVCVHAEMWKQLAVLKYQTDMATMRSEGRRVGKECVSACSTRGCTYH